ncbi:hypothetical protein DICPUDRAFT_85566 [Dictyostelium purpureum]|uniref:Uncharacterized protein n=1 Tax=Dictyostelium purpureum TaxID=5786 RepID=F1A647_DICPU|nr:uncharacterized protein DICPUDRAFT_85566 [Dictyostelium purpureum]EGC28336.1 hypothetical protein DICPUDRAFT_85566 [Dictyostelium purpureum]|eukprot:XP_003295141.1 hypothetical protein DICPUDRAFT_85566 [Dictyostelium purpureum]
MGKEISIQSNQLIQYHKMESMKEHIQNLNLKLKFLLTNRNIDEISISTIKQSILRIKENIKFCQDINLSKKKKKATEISKQPNQLIEYHKMESMKEHIQNLKLKLLFLLTNGNIDETSISTITQSIMYMEEKIKICQEINLSK